MTGTTKILLVDDDELIVSMLSRVLKAEGYDVRTVSQPGDVLRKVRSWQPSVVLLDIRMPGRSGIEILGDIMAKGGSTQVVMLTADDTAETAVKAMKLGAVDYLTKPFNVEEVKIVLRNIIEKGRLKREVAYLRSVQEQVVEREIIGDAPAIREMKGRIEKMAQASVRTLLITGESGSGKELFARYAHRFVVERAGDGFAPFVQVNCAAMPDTLLESELFGHEKGAFTDAREDKKGLFELAQGGTLLLDEIGEMRPALQAKLLRVLEERVVRPLGSGEEHPVDVMVIATTNRDLRQEVASGGFRTDLFFRLSGFAVHVPPLRERRGDIPLLAQHYLETFARRYNRPSIRGFSPAALALMGRYNWPGNIRELRNAVERIVVLETIDLVHPEHLPFLHADGEGEGPEPRIGRATLPPEGVPLEDVEKDLIMQALVRTHHNKAQAAKLLHISYDALRYQAKKFGLE